MSMCKHFSFIIHFSFIYVQVANHVLGSVLCSPGCFSVYRAAALRDVLPIYSSKVDSPSDFLTKDMGESVVHLHLY